MRNVAKNELEIQKIVLAGERPQFTAHSSEINEAVGCARHLVNYNHFYGYDSFYILRFDVLKGYWISTSRSQTNQTYESSITGSAAAADSEVEADGEDVRNLFHESEEHNAEDDGEDFRNLFHEDTHPIVEQLRELRLRRLQPANLRSQLS